MRARASLSLLVLSVLGFATGATATTLTIVSDKPFYLVGETITLTITGNSEGATAFGIFGQLNYIASLTTTLSTTQTVVVPWVGSGSLASGDGFATAFDQITGDAEDHPLALGQIGLVKLSADAIGIVNVSWGPDLDFFGFTDANPPAPISFAIVPATPEPAVTVLLGLGLVGLALGRRRLA